MNTIVKVTAVAAFAAFATPFVPASAAVPESITENVPGLVNYQGRLLDVSTGEPYDDGIYTLDIRLYDAASSGTFLWGGRYSAYVKNGYFNLMLGDSSAVDLSPKGKYLNEDLWKAMWPQKDGDTVRYLEVTPHENSSHITISEPTAIAPRQQLLTSPFAFRAQSAQYAMEAQGDFTVGGTLNVSGSINAAGSGNQVFGPIATSSAAVKLSGQTEAVTSSLPNVYDVGKYLYFYSYYDMAFKATAGNMTFTTVSGKKMSVTGNGEFSSTATKNTIGGTGATTISGSSVTIGGTGATVVKGSYARLASTTTDGGFVQASSKAVSMSPCGDSSETGIYMANSNVYVYANKDINLSANTLSLNSGCEVKIGSKMPIVIKEYTLKVTKGTASAYSEIPADNYRYVILEHRHYSGSSASMLQMDYSAYSHKMSSGATRLYISQAKYDNESDNTYKLTVVGFLVNMTSDVRTAM